ncbi:MAG: hypothetical protein WAY93_03325 [Atopobiaceae bacterium]
MTRGARRLRASMRVGGIALALACTAVVLSACQSTSSPQVAPRTDYPIHEASTITETYSDTSSSSTEQGVTPVTDPTQAASDSTTAATSTTIDTATLAEQVIAGDWGSGQDRIDALTAAGYNADDVQSQVNDMLGADTATGNEGTFVYTEPVQAENQTNSQAGVTWHDQVTEPIYEDQPVYQYCYIYTFTAVNGKSISPQVTSASEYIYATAGEAGTAANGSAAQNAALNTIRAAGYDAGKLSVCTYTITTPSKQTGTKRVQTGTRVIQNAGWY